MLHNRHNINEIHFYMGDIENTIFENNNKIKLTIYARYVDNIFLEITSEEEVIKLKKSNGEYFHTKIYIRFKHK